VEFIQVLTVYQIYHTWIHFLSHSPSSSHPLIPQVVPTGIIFAFIYTCTHFIALHSEKASPKDKLWTRSLKNAFIRTKALQVMKQKFKKTWKCGGVSGYIDGNVDSLRREGAMRRKGDKFFRNNCKGIWVALQEFEVSSTAADAGLFKQRNN
jgi:hypothetical protein